MDFNVLIFLAAVLGAFAVELMHLYNLRSAPSHTLIKLIRSPAYWVVTVTMTVTAGILTAVIGMPTPTSAFLIGAALPLVLRSLGRVALEDVREDELRTELKDAEQAAREQPEKPGAVWERARIQLMLYIERNLSQVRQIFIITVFVLLIGFALIGYGVIQAVRGNINAAALTSISGLLTEFVGATFLFIYRSTINQASTYVRTLERINAVGMSVQIVDEISEGDSSIKNTARADLIKAILNSVSERDDEKNDKSPAS